VSTKAPEIMTMASFFILKLLENIPVPRI
jgi:hypothetical protein